MDLAGIVALSRQSGLAQELQSVANNIANLSTTGFRREGLLFAEFVKALPIEGGSVAMTEARARYFDASQGSLEETGGSLDLAIEGPGYFTVRTPDGDRLTRAGAFTRDADGMIVSMDGHPLLDEGGGEMLVPFEARAIAISADGTLSVDGEPVGRIGLADVEDQTGLFREAGVLFRAEAGTVPVENGRVLQGFLEASNVNPVAELARMVEVQRAYEYGQKLMDQEDQRILKVVTTLGRQG
jgi:flagellar basal-body rod protein FlgF